MYQNEGTQKTYQNEGTQKTYQNGETQKAYQNGGTQKMYQNEGINVANDAFVRIMHENVINMDQIKLAIIFGIDINYKLDSLFILACESPNSDIAMYLVNHYNANITTQNMLVIQIRQDNVETIRNILITKLFIDGGIGVDNLIVKKIDTNN